MAARRAAPIRGVSRGSDAGVRAGAAAVAEAASKRPAEARGIEESPEFRPAHGVACDVQKHERRNASPWPAGRAPTGIPAT
ncbi:MAG TPA: hypothetical protein VJM48_03740 [Methylibium sp.]|nr:hypothetical protein [Methylibium sp.]